MQCDAFGMVSFATERHARHSNVSQDSVNGINRDPITHLLIEVTLLRHHRVQTLSTKVLGQRYCLQTHQGHCPRRAGEPSSPLYLPDHSRPPVRRNHAVPIPGQWVRSRTEGATLKPRRREWTAVAVVAEVGYCNSFETDGDTQADGTFWDEYVEEAKLWFFWAKSHIHLLPNPFRSNSPLRKIRNNFGIRHVIRRPAVARNWSLTQQASHSIHGFGTQFNPPTCPSQRPQISGAQTNLKGSSNRRLFRL